MIKRRSINVVFSVLVILLATTLTMPQLAIPTWAGENAPNQYWYGHNFSLLQGPPATCVHAEYPGVGKYIGIVYKLPMIEWQGYWYLSVRAQFIVHKWDGAQWQLYKGLSSNYFEPQWQDWSKQGEIAFGVFPLPQPLFYPSSGYVGGKPEAQVYVNFYEEGYYAIELLVSPTGQDPFALPVPIVGPSAYSPWICGPTTTSAASDLNKASLPMHLQTPEESPHSPRHVSYLPLAVRSLDGAYKPTPNPTATPPMEPFPTPQLPSTTQGIVDPGFESGAGGAWEEYSSSGYDIVSPGDEDPYKPRSGKGLAWLGGLHNEASAITQTLTVPETHPFLSVYALITSEEKDCNYDTLSVSLNGYIVANNGFCSDNNVESWTRSYLDLRPYAGQEVIFSVRMNTDQSLLSSLFLDDLTFESGIDFSSPTPTANASPTPKPPTPTPTATQPPPTPTPTATASPTPLPAILNPGFELGDNGDWTTYSQGNYQTIYQSTGAHSGNWLAWLGGANNEIGYVEQTMYVPADKPFLTLWLWINSEDVCGYDFMTYLANSVPFFTYSLCTQNNTNDWVPHAMDLSAFAGGPITIQVRATTDGSNLSSLYLDDFAFSASPPAGFVSRDGVPPVGQGDQLAPPGGLEAKAILP